MYSYHGKHRKQPKRRSAEENLILVLMFVLALISASIPFLFA